MAGRESAHEIVRLGEFELDRGSGELWKGTERLLLPDQPFRILLILIRQPGSLVSRDELRHELWAEDTFVDFEHSLNAAIKRLREALGDSASEPRFIETLPRRGYRFIAPVGGSTPAPSEVRSSFATASPTAPPPLKPARAFAR